MIRERLALTVDLVGGECCLRLGTTQYPGVRINHITRELLDADRAIFQVPRSITLLLGSGGSQQWHTMSLLGTIIGMIGLEIRN